jgi:hypothetical protein
MKKFETAGRILNFVMFIKITTTRWSGGRRKDQGSKNKVKMSYLPADNLIFFKRKEGFFCVSKKIKNGNYYSTAFIPEVLTNGLRAK